MPEDQHNDPNAMTQHEDPSTAAAPPFREPGRPIPTQQLQLRDLPSAGDRVHDFELQRELGQGSFARVFLARQVSLGRLVALKVSHNYGQEARTMASLEHDHIVSVFSEVTDAERGWRLLCMQFVSGTTLGHIIDSLANLPPEKRDGRAILDVVDAHARDDPPPDTAAFRDREMFAALDPLEAGCWLGGRLAEALAHAHGKKVLHRDVKPANILINRYGRPLLADFNVSARTDVGEGQPLGGTMSYMAPEHLSAFDNNDPTTDAAVGARSDIYSLGVVLYEFFTGHLPFDSPDLPQDKALPVMAAQRRAGAPLLSKYVSVPAALERVIGRCLAPDPRDRYQSAAELSVALESCRELCRVRREMPRGHWLTRAAVARPFLIAAILITLPHVLGSAINIPYNLLRIVKQLKGSQEATFLWVVLAYNAVVYPLCVTWFFRQWLLVYRVWKQMALPVPMDPAVVDDARRRALRLPMWCVLGSAVGWLPGGLLFPLLIDLFTQDPAHALEMLTYWKFLFSFTVSGLVALTYSVIATEFVVVRVLYPGLWLDARRGLRATAKQELAREEGRLAVLQFLAVLIPLAGASLLLGVPPEQVGESYLSFRVLVVALLAVGAVGMGVAILAARELRQAVDALTARGRA